MKHDRRRGSGRLGARGMTAATTVLALLIALGAASVAWAAPSTDVDRTAAAVSSPDGRLSLALTPVDGQLRYSVQPASRVPVLPPALGLRLTDGPPLGSNATVTSSATRAG